MWELKSADWENCWINYLRKQAICVCASIRQPWHINSGHRGQQKEVFADGWKGQIVSQSHLTKQEPLNSHLSLTLYLWDIFPVLLFSIQSTGTPQYLLVLKNNGSTRGVPHTVYSSTNLICTVCVLLNVHIPVIKSDHLDHMYTYETSRSSWTLNLF